MLIKKKTSIQTRTQFVRLYLSFFLRKMLFSLMSFNVNNTSSEKLLSLIALKLLFLYYYYNILSFSVFSYQTDRVETSPSVILINPIYFLSQSVTNLVSILFSRGLSNGTFILREATIFAQIYVKTWICVDHQIVLGNRNI